MEKKRVVDKREREKEGARMHDRSSTPDSAIRFTAVRSLPGCFSHNAAPDMLSQPTRVYDTKIPACPLSSADMPPPHVRQICPLCSESCKILFMSSTNSCKMALDLRGYNHRLVAVLKDTAHRQGKSTKYNHLLC